MWKAVCGSYSVNGFLRPFQADGTFVFAASDAASHGCGCDVGICKGSEQASVLPYTFVEEARKIGFAVEFFLTDSGHLRNFQPVWLPVRRGVLQTLSYSLRSHVLPYLRELEC